MRRTRGFSLIELLTVITILIIIAAFAYPSYIDYKAAAHCTQDLSKLRDISRAMLQYTSDNDGQWIPSNPGKNNSKLTNSTPQSNDTGWPAELCSYFNKSMEAFQSPADKHLVESIEKKNKTQGNPNDIYFVAYYVSWGYNFHFLNTSNDAGVHASKVLVPSETIILANSTFTDSQQEKEHGSFKIYPPIDRNSLDHKIHWEHRTDKDKNTEGGKKNYRNKFWNRIDEPFNIEDIATHPTSKGSISSEDAYGRLWPRHRRHTKCNVAFADGSVKSMKFEHLTRKDRSPIQRDLLYYWVLDKDTVN